MKILSKIKSGLFTGFAKVALKLFGNKVLKGYRSIIVAVLTFILGLWSFIEGSAIFDSLCEAEITVFCDFDKTKLYGGILVFIGWVNYLLRLITDDKVPGLESE